MQKSTLPLLILLVTRTFAIPLNCVTEADETTTGTIATPTTEPPDITCYKCDDCYVSHAETVEGCDYEKLRVMSHQISTIGGNPTAPACKTCTSSEFNCRFTLDCISIYEEEGTTCRKQSGVKTCHCTHNDCNIRRDVTGPGRTAIIRVSLITTAFCLFVANQFL